MNRNFSDGFYPFDDLIWLNCAHQGPLPRVAVEAAREAINWKIHPHHLFTSTPFTEVPLRLKHALGKLIGVPSEDIILGNSASYGLHLLANGIPWQAGNEILLVKGDFPSDILPWLALEKKGVHIRLIEPHSHVLQVDELLENISPASKLLCTTWVHSFSGWSVDLDALGEVCRSHDIIFFLNCSQALGARSLDIPTTAVDAITCVGFKWLCGPYGTGFCWVRPELRESLEYNQAYWLAMQTAEDLGKDQDELVLRKDLGARTYDVFGTANFFNFKPWTASVEHLLELGIERILKHNNRLISRLIEGLDDEKYYLISPREGPQRSCIVVVSRKDRSRNPSIHKALLKRKIYIAYRSGNLRISPHLYNTEGEIDTLLSALNEEI